MDEFEKEFFICVIKDNVDKKIWKDINFNTFDRLLQDPDDQYDVCQADIINERMMIALIFIPKNYEKIKIINTHLSLKITHLSDFILKNSNYPKK